MDLSAVLAITTAVVSFAAAGVWAAIRSRQTQKQAELEQHSITPDQPTRLWLKSRSFRCSTFVNLSTCWPIQK
jgi:hypothetical protein